MDHAASSVYSASGKLGLIVPCTNTVNETEWSRYLPLGVSVHTARMILHGAKDDDASFRILVSDLVAKMDEISPAEVGVIAYGCTADSMVTPPRALQDAVAAKTATKLVTTATAIADALAHVGARRITLATPFGNRLTPREASFFSAIGIDILRIAGMGVDFADHLRVPTTSFAALERHCREVFVNGSDALLITCTDLPTFAIIAKLERELGVPVITSNQATLWAALRAAQIDVDLPDLGQLMRAAG